MKTVPLVPFRGHRWLFKWWLSQLPLSVAMKAGPHTEYKVLLFCDYGTCSSFVPPSGTCWRHIQTIFLCSLLQKRNFQMGKLICCWVWLTLPQVTVLIEIKPRELKLHFFKSSWSHFKCSVTTGSQSCCSALRTFPSPWRSPSVKKVCNACLECIPSLIPLYIIWMNTTNYI